jgi:hypothetical protein
MLNRLIRSHESVVLPVSSNSAFSANLCNWDFEFCLSPCIEGFHFDSCIVSSPPELVDFLLILFRSILLLVCGITIFPHFLYIFSGLLFDFSCRAIL